MELYNMAQFFASATLLLFLGLFLYLYFVYLLGTLKVILSGKKAYIHFSNSSLYLKASN